MGGVDQSKVVCDFKEAYDVALQKVKQEGFLLLDPEDPSVGEKLRRSAIETGNDVWRAAGIPHLHEQDEETPVKKVMKFSQLITIIAVLVLVVFSILLRNRKYHYNSSLDEESLLNVKQQVEEKSWKSEEMEGILVDPSADISPKNEHKIWILYYEQEGRYGEVLHPWIEIKL